MISDVLKRNFVEIKGDPAGSDTIIFAHGFGSDHNAWKDIFPQFEQQYRLILFDHVGAGSAAVRSYSAAKYASIEAYAFDLIEICSTLNIRNTIFVGHSVGAMIGLLASLTAPKLFSKLVLIGASPRYLNDEGYLGGFTQGELDQLYTAMRANYLEWVSGFSQVAMRNDNQPELAATFAGSLGALRPDIALNVAKSIFQSDFRHILPQVRHEVLLIQAQKDIAVPQQVAEYMNNVISGSKLVTINAEGHFPHMSAPREIIGLIQEFIHQDIAWNM